MNYAAWPQRAAGIIIDDLIFAVPYGIGFLFLGHGGFATLIFLLLVLVAIGLAVYNRWILGGGTGQTWGRQAVNIRLISEQTGQPIGAGMAFVRDIAHAVDSAICFVGWLFPLWDAKRQTLADKILSTVVVPA